jgi:Cof subfamily protein (haloacid dehalogenase superfamily)
MIATLHAKQVRLVAVDLDGTLMGADLAFSPAVMRAASGLVAAGIHFVVASGRAAPSTASFQRALGVTGPLICSQGALVVGPHGEPWFEAALPDFLPNTAGHLAAEWGDEITFHTSERVFLLESRHSDDFYARWFGLPRCEVGSLDEVPSRLTKIVLVGASASDADNLEAAWTGSLAGVDVVRSHPLFVELVASGVSKASALELVAARLAVRRDEVLAIGDAANDTEMIAWAGTGVAMSGAPRAVLAAADFVAPPLDADGAAAVLEAVVAAWRSRGVVHP